VTRASGDDATGPDPDAAALAALRAIAARVDVAARLEPPAGEAILRSVVEAAAVLIRAEAASIALYDPTSDALVFRVAAGEHGQGVVGLSIRPGDGVAGYVFASGQPLAIGETTVDPRFQREAAEQTGYVPRSLLAVPLADDAGTIGVLEVLDRRDGAPFDLADVDAAGVFARQATTAIRATRLERDAAGIVRAALTALAVGDASTDPDGLDALVAAAMRDLDADGSDERARPGTWQLADAVARVRGAAPDQLALVIDILEALARRSARPASRFRGGRR
jgi:GAF domain-containing protein